MVLDRDFEQCWLWYTIYGYQIDVLSSTSPLQNQGHVYNFYICGYLQFNM